MWVGTIDKKLHVFMYPSVNSELKAKQNVPFQDNFDHWGRVKDVNIIQ